MSSSPVSSPRPRAATPLFGFSALLSILTTADGNVTVSEAAPAWTPGTEVEVTLCWRWVSRRHVRAARPQRQNMANLPVRPSACCKYPIT